MGDVCVGFSVGGWWRLGFLGFGFLDFRLVLVGGDLCVVGCVDAAMVVLG